MRTAGGMRTAASLSSAEPPTNPHPLCSSVTRRPQKCVRVPNVCFEAEQILLHGKTAPGALRRLNAVLNKTRDPSDAFSRLRTVEAYAVSLCALFVQTWLRQQKFLQ